MPSLTQEKRNALLQALSLRSGQAENIPPKIIYPVPEHLRALEAEVVLIVGDRGAGKTQLRNAFDVPEVREALARHAPGVRVPKGQVDWVSGWPLQTGGPDSGGWSALLGDLSAGADARTAIWGAYLLRSVKKFLTPAELREVQPVLEVRGVDAKGVLAAQRQVGVPVTASLDALDERLAAEDRWVFVSYDELDTMVMENWETLGNAIRGLVSYWAGYARRWRRLRPKIFLRSDFYKHHREIAGADVAKLAGNRVELRWSDKNLYGALIKHVLNRPDPESAALLRAHFGKVVPTTSDSVLGLIPLLNEAADAKPFVDRLVSQYMGANRGKGLAFRWILDHLRDGNGHAVPRSLVLLIERAVDFERDRPRASGAHLLHHVSVRNALDKVSMEYVNQAQTNEFLWLEGLAERLQQDREVPWTKRELMRLLGRDFNGKWSTSSTGVRPPGLDPEELLEGLGELGVIRARPDEMFDVPDLYLQGLDLRRKGGVAKQ
jgi:hypothetical protein